MKLSADQIKQIINGLKNVNTKLELRSLDDDQHPTDFNQPCNIIYRVKNRYYTSEPWIMSTGTITKNEIKELLSKEFNNHSVELVTENRIKL